MSKPKRPDGNQARRSQSPNKKPNGGEPIAAAMAPTDTVLAPVDTAPAPAAILSAPAEIIAAPAKTVSAPAKAVSAPAKAAPAPAEIITAPAKAVSAPAKAAPAPAKAMPAPANTASASADAVAASANTFSSGIQTIAAAYGDYTKKSFENTKCYVEKLASVRSLDKAIEVQTEFAKAAYETFIAESQKIRGLYSDLAKQTFKPFVPKAPQSAP
jgi:hypothetical protein